MVEKARLIKIVGAGNASDKPVALEEYASDMSFVNKLNPEYIVKVRKTADIEKLIKLTNKTDTPLVPVSSGPPHFRGDTVPSVGGAIFVDLSGMKKVIRVDRYNRVVMFEPGVTFGELIPAATKEGLRLNMPLMPRKSKSVVGSMLEREPVIMPKYHWDIADPLCDVEIIYGSGDLFRTGAAAGPGTLEEQWEVGGAQKEAAGPSSASWYRVIQAAQGTMGIVTWASARCEIIPQMEEPFLVGSNDLDKIMEMVHWLQRLRLVNECFILNNTDMATIMARGKPADYNRIKSSLPVWILFYNVAGYDYLPEERVKGQVQDIKELCQRAGVEAAQSLGSVSAFKLLKTVQSPPGDFYWKTPADWTCYEIFFISDFQKVGELIATMYTIVEEAGYATPDMGVYVQPIVQGINYHVEFDLFYNPGNPVDAAKSKAIIRKRREETDGYGCFLLPAIR